MFTEGDKWALIIPSIEGRDFPPHAFFSWTFLRMHICVWERKKAGSFQVTNRRSPLTYFCSGHRVLWKRQGLTHCLRSHRQHKLWTWTQSLRKKRRKKTPHIAFHNLTDVWSIRLIECTSLILGHGPCWQRYQQSDSCSLHAGNAFLVQMTWARSMLWPVLGELQTWTWFCIVFC